MGVLTQVLVNMNLDTDKAKQAAMRALKAEAMVLKGRSQALCPVKSGTLRKSCVIEESEDSIVIGYGGEASDYAAIQHENLQFHHTVGQAKYLEQPFDEMEDEILAAVEAALVGALR